MIDLEQISLRMWQEVCKSSSVGESVAVNFAKALISKLAEQDVEPVAVVTNAIGVAIGDSEDMPRGANLYTESQLIAAQQKAAEACARYCAQTLSPSKPIPSDSGRAWVSGTIHCADGIRNGNWREYL